MPPPIYDYFCEKCSLEYEVIKSIKDYDGKDKCTSCGKVGNRVFSFNVHFIGTKIEDAEWNPGLGAITKSKKHRDELAKRKNMVEIGNESTDSIHKHFDSVREDKAKKAYDDI